VWVFDTRLPKLSKPYVSLQFPVALPLPAAESSRFSESYVFCAEHGQAYAIEKASRTQEESHPSVDQGSE
jgi:hypothetical protein